MPVSQRRCARWCSFDLIRKWALQRCQSSWFMASIFCKADSLACVQCTAYRTASWCGWKMLVWQLWAIRGKLWSFFTFGLCFGVAFKLSHRCRLYYRLFCHAFTGWLGGLFSHSNIFKLILAYSNNSWDMRAGLRLSLANSKCKFMVFIHGRSRLFFVSSFDPSSSQVAVFVWRKKHALLFVFFSPLNAATNQGALQRLGVLWCGVMALSDSLVPWAARWFWWTPPGHGITSSPCGKCRSLSLPEFMQWSTELTSGDGSKIPQMDDMDWYGWF